MAVNNALAERIRQKLARRKGVNEKKMFGIGFLLNGNLCLGVWKGSLILRLGPEQAEDALPEPHVSELKLRGRSMKGWVLVAPEGLEDDESLGGWVERAVRFVAKLPAKP
jgi:TfoX N-terminal domain